MRPGSPLADQPEPEIVFNYLGQLDKTTQRIVLAGAGVAHCGAGISPDNQRPHVLGMLAYVRDGQLTLSWDAVPSQLDEPTLLRIGDRCVQNLLALADQLLGNQRTG